ncbi:MAG: hypothetical protein A3B70_08635 [Deltaproteobacteria bacterium RIFCSPHIGHO2_02_FULL_40_11]|nr:MAG: hypothetical protein A3B70_08635 [Deltaproteobacteria bacterium RIFCSPHIGHO2_02_FULL_40_11]
MKKLIISIKSSSEALDQFAKALKKARQKKGNIEPHYEVAFDNRQDFNKFLSKIYILEAIQSLKPQSVYDLAMKLGVDPSNLNKVILFFEEIGAIKIKEKKVKGKLAKVPVVDYESIEFKLAA